MKGKILLGLTAILMLTGAAVPVKADDVWKFDAQRFVLKEYTGTETDVVVPDTMDEGVPVKRLGTQLLAGSETLTSVVGSSITTIAGFIALCFMTFTLGRDLGIVMAKGVLLGVIGCVTVLPALILVFDKPLQKTKHKSIKGYSKDISRIHCGIFVAHSPRLLRI